MELVRLGLLTNHAQKSGSRASWRISEPMKWPTGIFHFGSRIPWTGRAHSPRLFAQDWRAGDSGKNAMCGYHDGGCALVPRG